MKPTYTRIVRNRSSREGGRPKLIVLHTTEGSDDLLGLAAYFDQSSTQASAHAANNAKGESIRMVPDAEKSWAVCSYNPYVLNLEQCGFASLAKEVWFHQHDKQLSNTAAWCAEWSVAYGIPLRRGSASSSTLRIYRTGVVQHKNLGSLGCGHSDCGDGYPQRYVVRLARLIVLEHHLKEPGSKRTNKLRKQINRQRKRYGLAPFASPAEK